MAERAYFHFTGDTHGGIDYWKIDKLAFKFGVPGGLSSESTDRHYLFIAGDFGYIWRDRPKYSSKQVVVNPHDMDHIKRSFGKLPFTTIFIAGNHENYNVLERLPKVDRWGSVVSEVIPDKVYMLHRGYVYTIEDKTILAVGGAESIDRKWRTLNKSWWSQEVITESDIARALESLTSVKHTVDYVLTHTAPRSVIDQLSLMGYLSQSITISKSCVDPSSVLLQDLYDKTNFTKWFFGHMHVDVKIPDTKGWFYALYNTICSICVRGKPPGSYLPEGEKVFR